MPTIDAGVLEKGPRGRMIRATAILDTSVRDRNGIELGKVHDIFGMRDGPILGNEPAYRVEHFLAGPGALGDRFGYDRHDMKGPWPIAALFRKLKSRSIGFRWNDIDEIGSDRIVLRCTKSELPKVPDLPEPDTHGRGVGDACYLGLRMLDSQILDKSGYMCGNVDDLELTLQRGRAAPYVSAILAGPGALAHRIGGNIGLWIESIQERLVHGEGPARIDFEFVDRVWHQIELTVPREGLEVNRFEEWVRDHFISKIPGASG